ERALEIVGRSGDVGALGYTHIGLGRLFGARGRHREALAHARTAVECFHEAGNRHAEAEALNGVAWCHALLEEFDEAVHHAEKALAMKKTHRSDVLDTLAYVEHHRGNFTAAIAHYLAAVAEAEDEGDRYTLADVLTHLGDSYRAIGDGEEARRYWQRAADLYDELHSPQAAAVRARM
ncbi:MAG: tetratricopeptide repeat protein, partial [Saccharothrix sp.]|nr:tetratricopeptide repeat protein [Saccharothrix sp.]